MNLGLRVAIAGALLIAAATSAAPARADVVQVLGPTRPPWFGDLINELETAGFEARVGGRPGDNRWALRVTSAPGAIDVLGRGTDGGDWIVDERVPLGRTAEARRRAIVRAVEILRARRFSAAPASHNAPVATEPGVPVAPPAAAAAPAAPIAPVATVPLPNPLPLSGARGSEVKVAARVVRDEVRPAVATAEIATPVVVRAVVPAGPISLGVASTVGGAGGGLGAVVGLGLVGRWTGHHLSLWSRAEAALYSTTVIAAEGSAAIRSAALSLGVGWSPRDGSTATWGPILGAEATGILIRAVGEGGAGYHGQTVVVPGLTIGALAGLRFVLARHVEASVQARAGIVAWEPTVTFAGRRVAAWQGALIATTGELSWRF